jgi:hypothetical protein
MEEGDDIVLVDDEDEDNANDKRHSHWDKLVAVCCAGLLVVLIVSLSRVVNTSSTNTVQCTHFRVTSLITEDTGVACLLCTRRACTQSTWPVNYVNGTLLLAGPVAQGEFYRLTAPGGVALAWANSGGGTPPIYVLSLYTIVYDTSPALRICGSMSCDSCAQYLEDYGEGNHSTPHTVRVYLVHPLDRQGTVLAGAIAPQNSSGDTFSAAQTIRNAAIVYTGIERITLTGALGACPSIRSMPAGITQRHGPTGVTMLFADAYFAARESRFDGAHVLV